MSAYQAANDRFEKAHQLWGIAVVARDNCLKRSIKTGRDEGHERAEIELARSVDNLVAAMAEMVKHGYAEQLVREADGA